MNAGISSVNECVLFLQFVWVVNCVRARARVCMLLLHAAVRAIAAAEKSCPHISNQLGGIKIVSSEVSYILNREYKIGKRFILSAKRTMQRDVKLVWITQQY